MRISILIALLAAASVLAAGCEDDASPSSGSSTSPATSRPETPTTAAAPEPTRPPIARPPTTIKWETCEDEPSFDCGELEVPLDYDSPTSRKLRLPVVRRPATGIGGYIGPLVLNPGGPGYSAIDFAYGAPYTFPREILDHFDIVALDPRGVGGDDSIDCGDLDDSYFELDFSPEDDAERAALMDFAERYAADCRSRNGVLLDHVGTLDAARDMEQLRLAIGAQQINYFGYSYGTLLGAAYADAYPDRVRAVVLDSAVDQTLTFQQSERAASAAFERAFAAFLDQCAAHRSCDFYADGDPHGAYDALIQRLESEPLAALSYDEGVVLTADDARAAVRSSMYDESSWISLAYGLSVADLEQDGTILLDIAYPPSDPDEEEVNTSDPNSAIVCVDAEWPDEPAAFDQLAQEIRASSPRVGLTSSYYDLPCVFWRADRSPLPVFRGTGAPPILVVASTGDPATPYEWGAAMAARLESARLLSYEGYIHGISFTAISACIDDAVVRYLVDLQLPEEGLRCTD